MNPFDFLKAINETKENLIVDDVSEHEYNAFIINRGLSLFSDTILFANEMNRAPFLDSALQNAFYINSIRKRKRYSKWYKSIEDENVMMVSKYYKCNLKQAEEYLSLMSSAQLQKMRKLVNTGGKRK